MSAAIEALLYANQGGTLQNLHYMPMGPTTDWLMQQMARDDIRKLEEARANNIEQEVVMVVRSNPRSSWDGPLKNILGRNEGWQACDACLLRPQAQDVPFPLQCL